MNEEITTQQGNVFSSITRWFKKYGYPPTLRDLCKDTGLKSTWTIRHHLKKLEEAGYIKINEGVSRGIMLLKNTPGVPLLGQISAGKPIDAIENIEANIDLNFMFSNIENIFALKVKGDSMTGAGIFNGDIVFVKKQDTAVPGEIVAALIGEEAVVKRFEKSSEGVKLVSENPKYVPIISKEVKILGKVAGILRKY